MNETQAKLIIKLNNVDMRNRTATYLSLQMDMEFSYVARLLRQMSMAGWLTKIKRGQTSFYKLTDDSILIKATKKLK